MSACGGDSPPRTIGRSIHTTSESIKKVTFASMRK